MENLFDHYGIFSEGLLHITPKETLELCQKGAVILDVREDYMSAFKSFSVPNIICLPLSELKQKLQDLPSDQYLITADAAGLRSKEAAHLLKDSGFVHIANLAGGMVEWERDGLPLLTDQTERLSGSCMCQLKPREKKKKT